MKRCVLYFENYVIIDSNHFLLPNLIELSAGCIILSNDGYIKYFIILTLACWVIFHASCRLLKFSKLTFSKNSFRNTIRVSNGLESDQDSHSVGPDLGPNCLQFLSADDKLPLARKDLNCLEVS